ncbi:MAG: glycoside hydrolase family 88 protein [Williamsia sp.]|nr:glycoside hydrolase family 88 protein [Williamsia sp.]
MKIKFFPVLLSTLVAGSLCAQSQDDSPVIQMVETATRIWNDSTTRYTYDFGVVLEGIEGLWYRTANPKYYNYIQKSMDALITDDGTIKGFKQEDYNLDNVKLGRSFLLLYKVTGKAKYLKAAAQLREQLRHQPRTSDGGFWHKKRYPSQMWLDGLYMAEPFYTEYAALFHEDTTFNDIARQFILMEKHSRDAATGLLYHGWDESKEQRWADKKTGRSPQIWGRAMGWYGMALVDVLEYFPAKNSGRDSITGILQRLAAAIKKYQDPKTGLWFDIVDKPTAKGNYTEASVSCMFVNTLAKGVRLGFLPAEYSAVAKRGYDGIVKQFVQKDGQGQTNLMGTVSVSGLGGDPYRDGSYEYYMSEKVVPNDAKGLGAFLLSGNEMAIAALPKMGKGKTVMLDRFFNSETIKMETGFTDPFHYVWEEKDNNGFYFFGNAFTYRGARIGQLAAAPTASNLKGASVYIIVDPDTKKETPQPNYLQPEHINAITEWVKGGGVLFLMGNDSGNAEFEHFNQLAEKFGIHFNENSINRVIGSEYAMGKFMIPAGNPLLKSVRQVYMKEVSTLELKSPATSVYADKGNTIIAMSKLGKGTVLAVGDPWVYDEYTDGRKIPMEYENYKAAQDIAEWLLGKSEP